MKIYEGKLVSNGMKIGIVAARFNEFITSKLLSGAIDGLLRENVKEDDVEIAWVRSYVLALSFAEAQITTITFAVKFPRG